MFSLARLQHIAQMDDAQSTVCDQLFRLSFEVEMHTQLCGLRREMRWSLSLTLSPSRLLFTFYGQVQAYGMCPLAIGENPIIYTETFTLLNFFPLGAQQQSVCVCMCGNLSKAKTLWPYNEWMKNVTEIQENITQCDIQHAFIVILRISSLLYFLRELLLLPFEHSLLNFMSVCFLSALCVCFISAWAWSRGGHIPLQP